MPDRESRCRFVTAAEIVREHDARITAMSTDDAVRAVLDAASALMNQEGDRINAHPFDWTYHGCDPAWRALGSACADLAEKQLGIVAWRVPRLVLVDEGPRDG